MADKRLPGHVIRTESVANEGGCRVKCFLEPNCVSINVGPAVAGKRSCELNNDTDESPEQSALKGESGYIHYAVEVQNRILETLRSKFGHLTVNGNPRFAVSGFTLSVCPYLGIKICRWQLGCLFLFIRSLLFQLRNRLPSYVSMKNSSIINQRKSCRVLSNVGL